MLYREECSRVSVVPEYVVVYSDRVGHSDEVCQRNVVILEISSDRNSVSVAQETPES